MFQDYKVDPIKIAEAETFWQWIINLDNWAYPAYIELKRSKTLPTDYLIYIGMTKNEDLLTAVREMYRLHSIEYPLNDWTLADEYCKQREESKKDKDLEEREGMGWAWKYYICYKQGDYIVIATKVIPREPKKWCWRYWMNLKRQDDPVFYEFCIATMPVSE